MMFCQRCSTPLKEDQAERIDNPGTSGAGSVIIVCRIPCKPVPSQTAPAERG